MNTNEGVTNSNKKITGCCQGCTDRKLGCHNPDTCEKWAKKMNLDEKVQAARKEARRKEFGYDY